MDVPIADEGLAIEGATCRRIRYRRFSQPGGLWAKKLNEVIAKAQKQKYSDALHQLQNDVLKKVNGCATAGAPRKDDWIVDCADQSQVYTPLLNIIAELKAFGH